jgi:hypothetical protein
MAVLHEVVRALDSAWVAGKTAKGPQRVEGVPAPCDELVDVRLVTDVPDDAVVGAVEDPVQGDGQFNHSEVGAEMAAGIGDLLNEKLPDVGAQPGQFVLVEIPEIRRLPNPVEERQEMSQVTRPTESKCKQRIP